MPFPETPRVVFRNNPLVEVITQLRFPPILRILSEPPAQFQDLIRDAYPLYERDSGPSLPKELGQLLGEAGMAFPAEAVTHRFRSEDGTRVVSLTRDWVAVSDGNYRRWEVFREEIERAKQAVEEVYRPSFYMRIGLRYRDVIDPTTLGLEDQPWAALLNDSLLGLLAEEGLARRITQAKSEALISLDEPADSSIKLRHGFDTGGEGNDTRTVYVVDADLFRAQRTGGADALNTLDGFNEIAGNLFRWSITPRLHEALGPELVD